VGDVPATGEPASAAASPGKAAIALRITRVRLRSSRMHVQGTLGIPSLSRVLVVFTGRVAGHRLRVRCRALVYQGRFHAVLPLPRHGRRPARGVVSVRWAGDRGHLARRAARTVRLRFLKH